MFVILYVTSHSTEHELFNCVTAYLAAAIV